MRITRLGWQNGLLYCDSIYGYIVVSKLLDFAHPLLDFAHPHVCSRSRGAMEGAEDRVRTGVVVGVHRQRGGATDGGAQAEERRRGCVRTRIVYS
jgi:hypothetical protein